MKKEYIRCTNPTKEDLDKIQVSVVLRYIAYKR